MISQNQYEASYCRKTISSLKIQEKVVDDFEDNNNLISPQYHFGNRPRSSTGSIHQIPFKSYWDNRHHPNSNNQNSLHENNFNWEEKEKEKLAYQINRKTSEDVRLFLTNENVALNSKENYNKRTNKIEYLNMRKIKMDNACIKLANIKLNEFVKYIDKLSINFQTNLTDTNTKTTPNSNKFYKLYLIQNYL